MRRRLVAFLRSYLQDARGQGFVIGLSGGIDSAVVAALAAEAVGPDKVLGLIMPHETSNPQDARDGEVVARHLHMRTELVEITGIVKAVENSCHAHRLEGLVAANVRPRARMTVLYAHAAALDRLVLGTGNKSELLTGYFTKWGDGAADVYPIGDLYKTQVWELARELALPAAIVDKAPSAGLFPGQTDEAELGITYADLDRVLEQFEGGHAVDEAARRASVSVEQARAVERRIVFSAHKRAPLVIPKMGFRTPGLDWREPRSRHVAGASE